MKRTYELMFIVRPDMPEDEQSKLISTWKSSVSSSGGTGKSEVWGKRRLAYAVRRFHDGIFVLLTLEGDGAMVHDLERRLRVTEPVIKFITVRVDEEQKRLDKVKKIRDSRRRGQGSHAAAAAEAAAQQQNETAPE